MIFGWWIEPVAVQCLHIYTVHIDISAAWRPERGDMTDQTREKNKKRRLKKKKNPAESHVRREREKPRKIKKKGEKRGIVFFAISVSFFGDTFQFQSQDRRSYRRK